MKDTPVPHHRHDIYSKNLDAKCIQAPLPLPPTKGLPFKINTYDDVDEPRFDPLIHLKLEMPQYVRVLPDFKEMKKTPAFIDDDNGSRFAYSAPFQVFSQEGMRVLRKIIDREKVLGVPPSSARGNKIALRGLYYTSPFVRDLQACPMLREHFKLIAGEELVPHPSFCNSPQVNLSVCGAKGNVDIWHYDSVAYTGVVLLNNVEELQNGGKLEIMQHDKHHALDLLAQRKPYKTEAIGFEKAGKMILAQGSEILHQVTPVHANVTRISLIFAYAPANSFQPPKTILRTMQRVDRIHQMATYEFFREKAWQSLGCLKHYVDQLPFTTNGEFLGEKLRSVAGELTRCADLLQGIEDDTIKNFNENTGEIVTEFNKTADEQFHTT